MECSLVVVVVDVNPVWWGLQNGANDKGVSTCSVRHDMYMAEPLFPSIESMKCVHGVNLYYPIIVEDYYC